MVVILPTRVIAPLNSEKTTRARIVTVESFCRVLAYQPGDIPEYKEYEKPVRYR
jgi:DNA-binding Xre family transcriptional regulator